MVVDVVCGKELDPAQINATVGQVSAGAPDAAAGEGTKRFYEGKWYYFCSLACRQKFMATPDAYIGATS